MAEVREGRIEVAGLGTPVLESGPAGSSEAVLFLHGNPGSSEDWRRLIGEVGEFGRALAFDVPGFGRADKPRRFDYSSEGYGRFVGQALDQLGVQRVHLVVHDFGGAFGWAWIEEHGERLRSLVIFNTGLMTHNRWHGWARRWRTPVLGELTMSWIPRSAFRQGMRQKVRQLPPEFVDRMHEDFDWGTRRAVLKLYRSTPLPYAPATGWVERLKELSPPTLIVWGRNDPYASVRRVDDFREVFPQAQVEILDDSGHFPYADDPERVSGLAIPFLRGQVGP